MTARIPALDRRHFLGGFGMAFVTLWCSLWQKYLGFLAQNGDPKTKAFLPKARLLVERLEDRHTPTAQLGLPHESYGVWDRGGYDTVAAYPFTRGQEYVNTWQNVNSARHTFDWSSLDAQLQFAESQNEKFIIQIEPVGGAPSTNSGVPTWILAANGGGVPQYTDGIYTFGDYRDPNYKQYYTEMVQALAKHVRQDLPANLQARVAFVRVDTGTTGDEVPYQSDSYVQTHYPQYYIDKNGPEWLAFREWAFGVYRAAFQDGSGPVVPMLYQAVDNISNVAEWNWVVANVHGGFGVKFGGNGRGAQLTNSDDVPNAFKSFTVNPAGTQVFSRNEMDNTFQQPYFQLNTRLQMYWAAVEQLNAGMSVWDVNQNCLQDSLVNNYSSVFQFFNQWAAEVIPATAGGGFCIFHQGLDSSDGFTFPANSYGGGSVSQGNTARYTAICQAYSAQGAQMDDLNGATLGSNVQRGNNPGLVGFNDAGWNIVPGNYERFITQINPDTTSKALWRINGPLTSASDPYDRFGRRSDHASGNDTMYFDINDNLLPTVGQRVQLNVTYLDRGTGQFSVKYDAVGNAQKTALTVTKTGSNTWMTKSVVVTDWVFGNHGPSGSDLQLVNLATDASNSDTIFHGIEVIKLADVSVGTVGLGTVTGRNNAVAYSAIPSSVMQGQRLELTATPAPGWAFTGWSGALTGSDPHPFLFPMSDTHLTATFAPASVSSSADDFNSGTWSGGSGWNGDWATSGTITSGLTPRLSAGASITRTLATPLTDATLSFDWDLDRIASSESGTVEVYNGSSWITVWTQNDRGLDDSSNPNLVTSGNISLSGTITKIRFTLNATGNGSFYIDNVSLTGRVQSTSLAFSSAVAGTYGATTNLAATLTEAGLALSNKVVSFSFNGTTVGTATTDANGLATLVGVSLAGLHAGNYASYVSATFAGDSAVSGSTATTSLNITTAPLTIAANNQTKVYGAALPTLTASYSGFVNGDTAANLTTPPTLGTTATAASHVGTFPITASGAVDADYAISYVAGTLGVTKAPLTITADNQSKVYGASLPTLTASYSGFVNGDTAANLTTPPTLSTTATAASHVGTFPVTASAAVDADYAISYVAGTLGVTKAALTDATKPIDLLAVSAGPGVGSHVRVYNADGSVRFEFAPFEGYDGGVTVATGDVTGDGLDDIIVGAGAGAPGGHVKVFDGATGAEIRSFLAFDGFLGGVNVGAGDLDGDGHDEILVGAGAGTPGGHVKAFDGVTGAEVRSFFAYEGFDGGVNVSAGDLNGDGKDEIITGTATNSTHIKAFDAAGVEVRSFLAFDGFTGGVSVGAGDINGDGKVDILVGAATAVSHVVVYDGVTGAVVQSFIAFDGFPGGVHITATDRNGDGLADIAVGAGAGGNGHLKVYSGLNDAELASFFSLDNIGGSAIYVG